MFSTRPLHLHPQIYVCAILRAIRISIEDVRAIFCHYYDYMIILKKLEVKGSTILLQSVVVGAYQY